MSRPNSGGLSRRSFTEGLASGALIVGIDTLTGAWARVGDESLSSHFERLPKLDGCLSFDATTCNAYAQDYGQIIHEAPIAVLSPGSIGDISRMVRFARRRDLKIAVRGHGHQPFGQAQVRGGIVIDMTSLRTVHCVSEEGIDVDAGADWRTVVVNAFGYGLTPPVLTNYLGLTVGGTLSVGGIGLTTLAHGAQVDQTVQVQVVTGEGDVVTCSATEHRDLFEAVLVGQGQCGIITRAVLRAERVQQLVREYTLPYPNLQSLLQAGARVRDERRFDGVVALIVPSEPRWSYLLSAVRYFTPPNHPDDAALLADLNFIDGAQRIRSVDYLEYLDVTPNLDYAKSHADLGLCIPESAAPNFIGDMLSRLTPQDLGAAAAIRVFFLRSAPFGRPLLRLPKEQTFNYVVVLRSETNEPDVLARMLSGNRTLFESCRNTDGTLYPFAAVELSQADWEQHYGPRLPALLDAKRRYDPQRVFASGPNLHFPRDGHEFLEGATGDP